MPTREEYLARCREAAIALLDAGDPVGGIALMISDLRKANEPLYDAVTLRLLLVDVLCYRDTPEQVREWDQRIHLMAGASGDASVYAALCAMAVNSPACKSFTATELLELRALSNGADSADPAMDAGLVLRVRCETDDPDIPTSMDFDGSYTACLDKAEKKMTARCSEVLELDRV
jgi:hypothetical protein